ncbi:hypothetical protein TNCV_2365711 [Trichonephila clavipes]|nr:hypothetical protein TNCV_2365711 [Trichonephila clavipes]
MEWYEQQSECCPTQLLLLKRESETLQRKSEGVQWYSENVQVHILHGSHSVFGYPNNHVSQRCLVRIDSDKRRSNVLVFDANLDSAPLL